MDNNAVNAVLQQLQANKVQTRADNKFSAERRVKSKKKAVKKLVRKVPLGKMVGHCPNCQIYLGDKEVDKIGDPNEGMVYLCSRCGEELPLQEELPQFVDGKKQLEWRRHDKWGDASIPARAEKSVAYSFPARWQELTRS